MTRRALPLVWLLCLPGLVGCGGEADVDSEGGATSDSPPVLADVNVVDYFPMEPGMRWTYDVECPTGARTMQWNLVWPAEGGQVIVRTYNGTTSGDKGELIYRAREAGVPPAGESDWSYHSGVLVDVESDTLSMYLHFDADLSGQFQLLRPSQIYWTRDQEQSPTISEVQLFELESTPEGALPGSQPRQSVHYLISTYLESIVENASQVSLYTAGFDTEVPGYEGEYLLHYNRRYGPEDAVLFTEDLWFAKDVGLVRLEQTVDDEITFIQSLRSFERDTAPRSESEATSTN